MNVNFYLSNLNMVAKNEAIFKIAKSEIGENIIILTPDRNTLNIEKEILNKLGKKSVFNLNVTTFSRIAKSYLIDKGLYKNVLTKHASIALIKKILLEIKDELLVFKNNIEKEGFCQKIFETICLYKSCKIAPKDFYVADSENLLNYKLHDIKLIYTKYEEYFENEFTDSFNQLDLFESSINAEDYKNVIFYMFDFEDITPSIARVVAKLAKVSKAFNVCTTYSKSVKGVKNSSLFTNDIYLNLRNIFDLNGIRSTSIFVEGDGFNNEIAKNVFSPYACNKQINNDIQLNLISANNIKEELSAVLSRIKKRVLDGVCSYSEIAFVVSNIEDYRQELVKCFEKFDIDYYLDESDKLSNNILCKVVLLI
ncbi:MAG: hypothetical protein IJD48_00815, partial [Clostridia bacterium]|nr:hypothetical protein [Clostridia bacterium]